MPRSSLSAFGTNWSERRPRSFGGDALFITYPADIRANVTENNSHRPHVTGNGPCPFFPLVVTGPVDTAHFIGPTVVSVTSVCTVMPAGEQLAITAVQLTQLLTISVSVFFIAILRIMAVPCRYVYTKLHSLFACSFHKLLHHISLSVAPWAV